MTALPNIALTSKAPTGKTATMRWGCGVRQFHFCVYRAPTSKAFQIVWDAVIGHSSAVNPGFNEVGCSKKQPTSFNDNEWDAVVDKLNFENARIISRPWAADEDITECDTVDMMLARGNGSPAWMVQCSLDDHLKRMLA